jgi:hypothetical protein
MTDHFDDIPSPTRQRIAQALTADAIRQAELFSYRLFYSVDKIEALAKIPTERATLDQYEAIGAEANHIKDRLNEYPQHRNNAYLLAILEKAGAWQMAALRYWATNGAPNALNPHKAGTVDTPAIAAARAAIRDFLDKDRPQFMRLETGRDGDVFEAITMFAGRYGLRYEYHEGPAVEGMRALHIDIERPYDEFEKVIARLKHPGALAAGIPAGWRYIEGL